MKKTLICAIIGSTILTGCSTIGDMIQASIDPIGAAQKSCTNIGYQPGTTDFKTCVHNQSISIRQSNAMRAASQQAQMDSIDATTRAQQANARPSTTNCRQVGSYLNCTTF